MCLRCPDREPPASRHITIVSARGSQPTSSPLDGGKSLVRASQAGLTTLRDTPTPYREPYGSNRAPDTFRVGL